MRIRRRPEPWLEPVVRGGLLAIGEIGSGGGSWRMFESLVTGQPFPPKTTTGAQWILPALPNSESISLAIGGHGTAAPFGPPETP